MKISELITELQELQNEHGDLTVIHSKDDEMNYITSTNICEVYSVLGNICAIGIFPSKTELEIDDKGYIFNPSAN